MGQTKQNLTSNTTVVATQEWDVLECILLRLDNMEKEFTSLHLHPSPSRSRSPTSDQRYDGWRKPSQHRSPTPEHRRDT